MAAPLTKKAVRTTFVSGSSAAFRRLGCQAGTSTTASLFFVGAAILRVVLDHETHEAEPMEVARGLREGVGHGHVAGLEPGKRVELQRCDAERRGERALEPSQLGGKLDADHLSHGLARLDLVEPDRRLELLEEALDQERPHAREVE